MLGATRAVCLIRCKARAKTLVGMCCRKQRLRGDPVAGAESGAEEWEPFDMCGCFEITATSEHQGRTEQQQIWVVRSRQRTLRLVQAMSGGVVATEKLTCLVLRSWPCLDQRDVCDCTKISLEHKGKVVRPHERGESLWQRDGVQQDAVAKWFWH